MAAADEFNRNGLGVDRPELSFSRETLKELTLEEMDVVVGGMMMDTGGASALCSEGCPPPTGFPMCGY